MQEVLDGAIERVRGEIETVGVLVTRSNENLADQEGISLMTVGSRGWGPLRRVLLGSVSSHLVSSAPWPLIVFPRGAKAPGRGAEDGRLARAAPARHR